jgi:hypothetical protein
LPGIGDAAGLMGDASMYATDPASRTPGNYALSAAGLLPFVPAASVTEKLASSLQNMKHPKFQIIPVRTTRGSDKPFVSVENGQFVLSHPGVGFETERDVVNKYIQNLVSLPKESGRFYRFTNNAGELDLIKSGEIRPSFNFADNFPEAGFSVAESPHYGIQGYKHGYELTGDVIGRGSDGEPLLNTSSLKILSPIRPASELLNNGWDRLHELKNAFAQSNGVSIDQINAIYNGNFEFIPHGLSGVDLKNALVSQTINRKGPAFRAAGIRGYDPIAKDQASIIVDEFLRQISP